MEVQMTISASRRSRSRALRRTLLIGCALGLGLPASRAAAQAFNANPATVAGTVNYDRATPGVETIRVGTPTAIIRWTPNVGGNPIVFLPAGNVATFTNGLGNSDFVVLNRIMAGVPVRFDGTVLSLIQTVSPNTSRTGGTVLFSTPGGIIIGATAVFDVGSLVLTSLNVLDDGAGNFYDPATRGFNFAPFGGVPGAAVITEPGSQIRALEQGSYVAMVAPLILHGGSVRVNGSAAYIAGETVEMRVNQGLFDIIVKVGSDNAMPLTHLGTTGGPASTGAADPHAIYLVAMPKNQAITAILQGDIGFDPAVSAAVENGVIVLSAGANVVGGQVDRYGALTGTPAPDLAASFRIEGGTIRSDLFGTARTDMLASAVGTGSLTFLQDVSLFGGQRAHLSAGPGQTVTVMGNAIVSAAAFDSSNPAAVNLVGGEARIFTPQGGGNIRIFGSATVDASARGLVDSSNNAGSGTGGLADVSAGGGTITIDGALNILATGEGGTGAVGTTSNGGAGTGGTASLVATGGGAILANGVVMNANGTASASDGSGGVDGAAGQGGNVVIGAGGGSTVTLAGAFTASAKGQGGEVQGGPGLAGGLGGGGSIVVRSQGGTIRFNANAGFFADGTGGSAPTGGRGQGGDLLIEATSGSIDFASGLNGGVGGLGGNAGFASGGTGGVGQGGTIRILAHTGAAPSRIAAGSLSLAAPGTGGRGGSWAGGAVNAGTGGLGSGGAITILAESGNGTIDLGGLKLDAVGTGGSGGNADNNDNGGAGGDGDGGDILVGTMAVAGSGAPTGGARLANADLNARGIGGAGGVGRGAGGNGRGGTATLTAGGAPVTIAGGASLVADGDGGAGGDSPGAGFGITGSGAGGQAALNAAGAGGTINAVDVVGTANATGGTAAVNTPGQWHVTASAGGGIALANLTLSASANTPAATIPFSSVEILGGTVNVAQVAALDTLGEIRVIGAGAGRISGGQWSFTAGQDLVMSHANPAAAGLTIDVNELFVVAAGNFSAGAGVVTRTAGQTDIRATGNATIAGQILGANILLRSAALDVAAGGGIGGPSTASTDIRATGNATIAGFVRGQTIVLRSAGLNLTASADVGGGLSDSIDILATGAATVAGLVRGRNILFNAASLDLASTGEIGFQGGTTLTDVRTTGNATIAGQITGLTVRLTSAAINVAGTGAVGGAASNQTELRAAGTLSIAGRLLGTNILAASSDIDVGAGGSIGSATTQLVTLAANATGQPTTLGGAAQGPGYTLTGAEAGRIRAGTLRVLAPALSANPARAPDLLIRDLTLNGGGAAAGIGMLDIVSPGIARVEGALLLAGARAQDGISLRVTERLEVATPTGSVRVRDAAGAPGGNLIIASNNIWVASAAIIDRLRANPNYARRDDDLLFNDGTEVPRGFVEANGVTLVAGGTLYVQNNGSGLPFSTEYAGITVGPAGLVITAAAPGTNVTAFGRRLNADGSFTTGDAFFAQSTYNSTAAAGAPGSFTNVAQLNTCIIVTGFCGARPPANPVPGGPDPITGPTGGSDPILLPAGADEDDLVDTSFAADPLIEEPVTSGSESSLWDCDPDNDGDCDDQHD
jgi:hypothetical protein